MVGDHGGLILERRSGEVDGYQPGPQTCTHHSDDLLTIEAILAASAQWCPACGTRLPAQRPG